MITKRRLSLAARVFKLERDVFLKMCEGVDTPRALACYMLARHDEWEQYLDLKRPDPEDIRFADDYLVTEAMRKNPSLPIPDMRRVNATLKWWEAEDKCRMTNSNIREYLTGKKPFSPEVETLITKTQRIIADVLGPLTEAKLEFVHREMRFGPGATSSVHGRDVVLSRKMTSTMDVTPGLYPHWWYLIPHHGTVTDINLKAYSEVVFVPKDARTDRPIAIEPTLNIYVQLGIGALIRRQLSLAGLNLDTQADANRACAEQAYAKGLATIDLSSASDTVAYMLVLLLLPERWFALLDTARTEYSVIDDKEVRLSKFSSMGNGFTFELETLIFWALARASGDDNAVAFGDDIICRQDVAPKLIEALNLFGFSVNEKKTFVAGRFFESCGHDYLQGVNVRPIYFKGGYNDFESAVIRTCNKVRHYSHRRNHGLGCDIRFLPAWLKGYHFGNHAKHTGVPLHYGDDGLIRNFDEARPGRLRHGHQGYAARVWSSAGIRSKRTIESGAYAAALRWGTPDGLESRMIEHTRGGHMPPALRTLPVFTWEEPGPWCALAGAQRF